MIGYLALPADGCPGPGAVVLRAGSLLVSVGRGPGCAGRPGWAGAGFAAPSSLTTTCRIAGAQPMSAHWRGWWGGRVKDDPGAGVWPDGAGAASVVPVGPGVAGGVVAGLALGLPAGVPVGLAVGVAVVAGLDGVAGCDVGVRDGAGDALWAGVPAGAGVSAIGDDGVPGVNPPPGVTPLPLLTGPEAGTAGKSPCS